MMEKLQRFGGAMFTPVLLFAFNGILLAFSIAMQSELILGTLASEGTFWSNIWSVVEAGGWTIFNNMEILFVIGLPIGLANKASARAALASFVVYMTWNNFIAGILGIWGTNFGVDYSQSVGGISGLKEIGGVKTLDTNLIGALAIAGLTVWIHNRYFEKKLPEWLGVFQGTSMVVIIGFFTTLILAFLTVWIWPPIQDLISQAQGFMAGSGSIGVGLYVFLERILIPTGLHHFIYQPFEYGPAVVEGGLVPYWMEHLNEIASTSGNLRDIIPEAGFGFHNVSKVFAPIGIGTAFIVTAKPENRKKTFALVLPTALTAIMAGITEPFEFTFLFLAPQLFAVHALLAALLSFTLYSLGVSAVIGGGLLSNISYFIVPMASNHLNAVLLFFGVGLVFSVIYFFIFRFAILKWNIKTPGREDTGEAKMFKKADYREKRAKEKNKQSHDQGSSDNDPIADLDPNAQKAIHFLEGLGGGNNITNINNCATRLRVSVADESLIAEDGFFKQYGAHGLVKNGKALQVIVGLDVPQVREYFENEVAKQKD
ncbi:PTS alpha-glucoside transporter subunit IIBC [Marinilactibacillus sp. 15R]|uniref:PTS system maltose-specific IIB component, Glc family /PTS system maltose-specific IIC component, Glc family n=1 Tax=Marinilactibacillus piezotolerans TaxID=258723 RepID=A0A1I3VH58_9LACT|nr:MULTISPECIES: alpha-glucoside-specific PTS transporter subunit IIBC [Marinilactibacillus]API88560.1 PTS alpha-glucoside transporter subunit IIBC [Marinilactibacillus sp. 15R]SFJ93696.1 PTS system maltose-specific IIB component, Glc family /PTS system maltose-specific IIC component, Glc family [Marinilactibacillus piezotolerans]